MKILDEMRKSLQGVSKDNFNKTGDRRGCINLYYCDVIRLYTVKRIYIILNYKFLLYYALKNIYRKDNREIIV